LNDEPRQSTISDSLAFLRERWSIVVGAAAITVAVAVGLSLTQDRVYSAEASLRAKDAAEELTIAGLQSVNGELPAQVAAQAAQTAAREAVLRRVKNELGLKESTEAIRSDIAAEQDPTSNLVIVTGEASTAQGAADLTNATANAIAVVTNRDARQRYSDLAARLRQQSNQLGEKLPENFESLSEAGQSAFQNIVRQQQVLGEQAARLEALSTVSDLVQVIEPATTPSSPSSPKPLRSGVLGLIVGLVIGLIAAWVARSLDRRLRRTEEVEEVLGFPLVGAIARGKLGGSPVGTSPDEEHVARMDAFRMLRNNVRFLGGSDPPRSILVTSSLPEEGKTTVSIGIALAAAASGLRTLLVEADFHRPVHADRLGLSPGPGLADYLRGGVDPHDVLQIHRFVDPAVAYASNGSEGQLTEAALVCLTAGNLGTLSTEVIGSGRFSEFISKVQRAYDLVVIDSAPLLLVSETLQMVQFVDAVAFCVRLGQTTADQARAGRDALARVPDRLTALVLTDISAADHSGYSYSSYAYNYRLGRSKQGAEH
jgi:Mrp family chromosome partitioning ATPase